MEFLGIDPRELAITASYIGIFFIIFAQTGLLFGVIFPGTSFLLAAGALAAQQDIQIELLILAAALGSLLGDSCGYYLGNKIGPNIFKKRKGRLFTEKSLERTRSYYKKHGGKTIIFGRFIHFVRTFGPTLAGVGNMPYGKFLLYSFIGTMIWTVGIPLLGYRFGITLTEQYVNYLLGAFIILFVISGLRKAIRKNKDNH